MLAAPTELEKPTDTHALIHYCCDCQWNLPAGYAYCSTLCTGKPESPDSTADCLVCVEIFEQPVIYCKYCGNYSS